MTEFSERYKSLSAKQKEAVDTIDGPLLVVAGPGTGKTELLGVRVANILQKTDTLAENILCLTYTESGATAMRERLVSLIGQDAYKVSVQTFHGFGSEVINRYGEYFYDGAQFRAADELTSYEILFGLFEKLPHDNPLAGKLNDTYSYLKDSQATISDLKKAGLTPDELRAILEKNLAFIEWVQPHLQTCFAPRMSKKTYDNVRALLNKTASYNEDSLALLDYQPLYQLFTMGLQTALNVAEAEDSTKPLQAWKADWCEKRGVDGELTLKDHKRCLKLQAIADLYSKYLSTMHENGLYDFDDMIMRVVHSVELHDDLRFNLQEQYQYLLIDEFQDTNDAQMRLIWNLTNNPVNEGRPNVMAVGDDDQAIYRFQGANISNMLGFRDLYEQVKVITLSDNYRSSANILALSRRTIIEAEERLENTNPDINKQLKPHLLPVQPKLEMISFPDQATEYTELARRVAASYKKDPKRSHAVIARWHRDLQALLPYLHNEGLPLRYDRQDNVLDSPPIVQLELLARVVTLMGQQRLNEANGLLPKLLAHPAWGLDAKTIWTLSLTAYKNRHMWLEVMATMGDHLAGIAEWLTWISQLAQYEPLEIVLDELFGYVDGSAANSFERPMESPMASFFFPKDGLDTNPVDYLSYVNALRTIRQSLRDYQPDTSLKLADLVSFISAHRQLGLAIQSSVQVDDNAAAVTLLSAHKAKGLEFDCVTMIGLTDNNWGEAARSRPKLIRFPHNLPLAMSGDTRDERIRLLYVGLTRARHELWLTTYRQTMNGKSVLPVAYLVQPELPIEEHDDTTAAQALENALVDWRGSLVNLPQPSIETLLRPLVSDYRLSATHFYNFLDIPRGGPAYFLLQNLLRFPQTMSPAASFGSAIHSALNHAHQHLRSTGNKRPVEDVLGDFEKELDKSHLSELDIERLGKKGADVLQNYLRARYDSFTASQKTEQSFAGDDVHIGDARLSGVIDLMDIDEKAKTIVVTDYKTGKPTKTWQGRTDYEKIKLHHYKQQLMLYKLLIENSRTWRSYTVTRGVVEYVEPLEDGTISCLELEFNETEITELKQLVQAVWRRIQTLDFTLPDAYSMDFKGIMAFEATLLDQNR